MTARTLAEPAAPGHARLPIPLLIGLYALSFISVNIILPSMPAIALDFATDVAAVQGALSVFLVGLGLGQLIYGPISDRLGRKPVLLAGIVVFVLGCAICCFAGNIASFLIGRLLQATGAAAGASLGRAMIRDVYGPDRSAGIIGYTVMATSVASGFSPVTGSVINLLAGWRTAFAILMVFGLVLLAICAVLLKETRPATVQARTRGAGGWYTLLGSRRFLHNTLFSSFLTGCWYGFVAGAPVVVMTAWHQSPTGFALWWTLGSVSYVLGSFIAGRYSRAAGARLMISGGSLLITLGAVLMLAAALFDIRHPFALFGPMGLLLIGFGMAQPSSVASAINTNPNYVGAASGVLGSAQIFFSLGGISVIGLVPRDSALPFVIVCAGMALAAVLSYFALRPRGSR